MRVSWLKPLLDPGQYAAAKRRDRVGLPGRAVAGQHHALRVVHQEHDDVLLRLQLGERERRLPQQQQQDGRERRLQQPDAQGPHLPQSDVVRRRRASPDRLKPVRVKPVEDVEPETRRHHRDRQPEQPRRPRAQENDMAARKRRQRIFEEQLEHEGRPWTGSLV